MPKYNINPLNNFLSTAKNKKKRERRKHFYKCKYKNERSGKAIDSYTPECRNGHRINKKDFSEHTGFSIKKRASASA